MSSLLEQAIVDASALKEAALKNAEASVIEKYSDEVKKNLDQILEQDDMGLGALAGDVGAEAGPDAGVDVPLGAAEGEDLCPCPDEDEETEIEINFDELAEALKALNEEVENLEEDSEEEINEVEVELAEEEEIEEETEMDSLVAAIMEKLSEELEEPIEEAGGAELAGSAAAAVADKESLESEEGEDSKGDSDDDPGSYAGEEGQATNEDIDIDSQFEVAQKYYVRSVPTVIIEKNGEEVQRFAGLQSELAYTNALNEIK